MARNEGLFGAKFITLGILLCLMLSVGIPMIFSDQNASGKMSYDANGVLVVDGGQAPIKHEKIEQNSYTTKGIEVKNGGVLTIKNTTVHLQMDLGSDGSLGGGDDHTFGIQLSGDSELYFENCVLTVASTQTNPYMYMNISVDSSLISFVNTTVAGAGILYCDAATSVLISNTTFHKTTVPSTVVDTDPYDDGMSFYFLDCDDLIIKDSELNDMQITSGQDGTDITLVNSELYSMNTYYDIDFVSSSENASNKFVLVQGSKAKFYACEFNETENTGVHDASAIWTDGTSTAFLVRLVNLWLNDLASVPIHNTQIQIQYKLNSTDVDATPSTPILDYLGRSGSNWDYTDDDGYVVLPIISDRIDTNTLPNSHYIGKYQIKPDIVGFGWETVTLASYPGDDSIDKSRDNFPKIYINSTDYLVNYQPHPYYDSPTEIIISTQKNITGSYSVVDGKVYQSYYSLDKNLKVTNGGHLTFTDTFIQLLQDIDTHFYIVVEGNGILEFDNVTLASRTDEPVNVYVVSQGGTPEFRVKNSNLNLSTMVIKDAGIINMTGTTCISSIYAKGTNANVLHAQESTIESKFLRLDGADVTIHQTDVITDEVSVLGCEFSGINVTIDQPLKFSVNDPEIVNISFSQNVAKPHVTVQGSIQADIYWWVRVNVIDKFKNPLPDADVKVSEYDNGLDLIDVYDPWGNILEGKTQSPHGSIVFALLEKTVDMQGLNHREVFHGNYFFNASFQQKEGFTEKSIGTKRNVNISIDGAPDLRPADVTFNGSPIQGNDMEIKASIFNDGSFSAGNILVKFVNEELPIGEVLISKLAAGEHKNVTVNWESIPYGIQNITVAVDPKNQIGEENELDNNLTIQTAIGYGPDYTAQITSSNSAPTQNTWVNFTALVMNQGDIDIEQNPVTIKFYLGDPSISGVLINQTVLPAIGSTPKNIQITYMFINPGIQSIYVTVESKYDADESNNVNFTTLTVRAPADLVIQNDGIVFNPVGPVGIGQNVKVSITFSNIGSSDAYNFMIAIYDKVGIVPDPLRSEVIPVIKQNSEYKYNFTWKPTTIGSHELQVKLDPAPSKVVEINESNNNASKILEVGDAPNLAFDEEVTFNPTIATNGSVVKISVVCRNNGGTPATGIMVRFYVDTPINLINYSIIDLAKGESRTLTLHYTTTHTGPNLFLATIDEQNEITETNEADNQITKTFQVVTRADLKVTPADIEFLDSTPLENGGLTNITVTVHNTGETDSGEFKVRVYDGDPNQDGRSIGYPYYLISGLPSMEQTTIDLLWNTTVTGGNHDIYVVVDTDDDIYESNEENNLVYKSVWVKTIPDLFLYDSDVVITTSAGFPVETVGDTRVVFVEATIRNQGDTVARNFEVKFRSKYTTEADFKVLGTQDIPMLAGNSAMTVELLTNNLVFDQYGDVEISVEVDSLSSIIESIEDNNEASTMLHIYTRAVTPDLEFGNVTIKDQFGSGVNQNSHVINGSALTVTIETNNIGGVKTNRSVTMSVFSLDPRNKVGKIDYRRGFLANYTIANIEPDQTRVNTTIWAVQAVGKQGLYLFIDSGKKLLEYAEDNNNFTFTVNVTEKPNLVPSISVNKQKVEDGQEVTITVVVSPPEFNMFHLVEYQIIAGGSIISSGKLPSSGNIQEKWKTERGDQDATSIVVKINTGTVPVPETNTNDNSDVATIKVTEKETINLLPIIIGVIVAVVIILAVIGVVLYLFVFKKKEEGKAVCSECGAFMDLEATECPSCGAEFSEEVECGECGGLMNITDTVCPSCGATFGEVDDSALPAPGAADQPTALPPAAPGAAPVAPAAPPGSPQAQEGGQAAQDAAAAGEDEVAECYMCGSIIPISAPMCPICGAEFE